MGYFTHIAPVRAVRSQPKHGEVVREVPGDREFWARCSGAVVNAHAFFRHFPIADDQSRARAELQVKDRAIFVGHGSKNMVGELPIVEQMEVANYGPSTRRRRGLLWLTNSPLHPLS